MEIRPAAPADAPVIASLVTEPGYGPEDLALALQRSGPTTNQNTNGTGHPLD